MRLGRSAALPALASVLVAATSAGAGARGGAGAARGAPAARSAVTFNRDVAPIVFEQCASCHRPGEVAPFSLLTYADVKKRAPQIAQVTSDRFMPPWKSIEGHGRFIGERRLTTEQIELIGRWVKDGAAEGEAADLPAIPKFNDSWT